MEEALTLTLPLPLAYSAPPALKTMSMVLGPALVPDLKKPLQEMAKKPSVEAQKVKVGLPGLPLVVATLSPAVPLARPGCHSAQALGVKFPPTTPPVAGNTAPSGQVKFVSAGGGRQPSPPATKLQEASTVEAKGEVGEDVSVGDPEGVCEGVRDGVGEPVCEAEGLDVCPTVRVSDKRKNRGRKTLEPREAAGRDAPWAGIAGARNVQDACPLAILMR